MFTGLVEELGKIKAISKGKESLRLTIEAFTVLSDVKLGDSIAINGTCLTVVEYSKDTNCFSADVMPETIASTVIAKFKIGDRVNLERSLNIGGRFGGHIVSGHVDGIGMIIAKENHANAIIIEIQTVPSIMCYIVKKGSIAIDGISLTVVDYAQDFFSVSLIPHTASVTTLGIKKLGDYVNLEIDIIGKYIKKFLCQNSSKAVQASTIDWDFLTKHGF